VKDTEQNAVFPELFDQFVLVIQPDLSGVPHPSWQVDLIAPPLVLDRDLAFIELLSDVFSHAVLLSGLSRARVQL
jgi:hypothetical protein